MKNPIMYPWKNFTSRSLYYEIPIGKPRKFSWHINKWVFMGATDEKNPWNYACENAW